MDRNGNILQMRMFRHSRGHRHSAETPLNQFYPFGLWTWNEIRLESSLSMNGLYTCLVPVSHVQSHPGMHASNPGWLWTRPVFYFERVIKYQEYTHVFIVPLWLLYHPQNWNFIFSFRLSTESLTTILITCFLCPSKEGTKSMQGKKICAKLIVIYNVHTLP